MKVLQLGVTSIMRNDRIQIQVLKINIWEIVLLSMLLVTSANRVNG